MRLAGDDSGGAGMEEESERGNNVEDFSDKKRARCVLRKVVGGLLCLH